MKIFLAFIIFSFCLTGCSAREEQNLWDFGKVKEGQVLRHFFVLKNESFKTLMVKDVSTSCGCTISEVKQKQIPAGGSTLIEVKFDTKGYSGATKQYIYVNTDAIDNPVVRFIIKADIEK